MRLRPSPDFSFDFHVEYDVNFKQIRRTSVSGNVNRPRFNVVGGWSRSVRLAEDPAESRGRPPTRCAATRRSSSCRSA